MAEPKPIKILSSPPGYPQ